MKNLKRIYVLLKSQKNQSVEWYKPHTKDLLEKLMDLDLFEISQKGKILFSHSRDDILNF